ncbi:hypothetical protein VTJ83DRAFT_3686 [Remersonia thermophila]|uniref:Uncharacterized protein n=1 Tax=Remersonia thermophila TaxID=72144 RepID=A0ABR4DEV7_9PEZI
MANYYDSSSSSPWPASGQQGWDHQTPPPARSGASSAIPREEPAAFLQQFEEVDRAIDNLVKSGKMFGGLGPRRESMPYPPGPARMYPVFPVDGRPPLGPGPRPHPVAPDFGDARGPHPGTNLQSFYASQRHQPSRGSNEAEQMMQAKRRMAAQRERDLRNYHQEQQYNRTVLADMTYGGPKPDRTMSPGSLPDEDRRKLLAQQRSALYGEGSFGDDAGPASLRGHSPLAYEYGRAPPVHPDAGSQAEGAPVAPSAGSQEQARVNNSSPQSNPGSKGVYDAPAAQPASRTSASSPGGSPPRQGGAPGSKPAQSSVAPIGTRPSVSGPSSNSALNKRSTTPSLSSPLSQGYTAPKSDESSTPTSTAASNPPSASVEGGASVGLAGWGARPNGWGGKSGLGQASVWG